MIGSSNERTGFANPSQQHAERGVTLPQFVDVRKLYALFGGCENECEASGEKETLCERSSRWLVIRP